VQSSYSFQTTGVDLAGPLHLKGGSKAWIILYTCATYQGIHFDVLDSKSTEELLQSPERLTGSTGRSSQIYTDHGTNFVGAYNIIKELDLVFAKPEGFRKPVISVFIFPKPGNRFGFGFF